MKNQIKLLIIEDNEDDVLLEINELQNEGFDVVFERVETLESLVVALNKKTWDCIISDYNLPRFNGIDAYNAYKKTGMDIPFILVSGTIGEENAVAAMKTGIHDYIMKDNLAKIAPVIKRELREAANRMEKRLADIVLKEKMEILRRMATVVSDSNDAVILYNLEGKILAWNRGAIETYGYPEAEALGMHINDIVPENDRKETKNLIRKIMLGETGKSFELRRLTKDGRILDVWLTITLLTNENGEPLTIATTERDITGRKQEEQELITAKEKAEESDRLKTAFLNNISHEIRTPMNAIVGFSDLLNDHDLNIEERRRFTDIIIYNSNQLLSIITDIVSIATIEAGQETLHEKEINLNAVFKFINEQLFLKDLTRNVSMHYKTSLADEEAFIVTDENKLTRILLNLIGNALKFTLQGYIEFGYLLKDMLLEFYVKDTGIGISPEMHTEIFKRFRQVEITPERQFGGSGLGLSISKAYVEFLGGEIRVDSILGNGSTFSFTIPYKKVNKTGLSEKHTVNGLTPEFARKKTILVTEDEDFNFSFLLVLLSKIGFNIIRAKNGDEAIEICKSDQLLDLVLMEMKMPFMDGYEATKILKMLRPGLPVIAQSAYSDEDDKAKAMACGCSDFLSKPFKKEQLLLKISKQLVNRP